MIQHISAVTFAVRAMPEALTFYTTLGFTLIVWRAPESVQYPPGRGGLRQSHGRTDVYADLVGPDHIPGEGCG